MTFPLKLRRMLLALTCVFGLGSMAHADPRIPEFGVGAGYYGWIGIGEIGRAHV